REAAARPSGAANGVTPPGPAADRERVLLLECRLEEMRASLDAARTEADQARVRLADAAAREAGHARRFHVLHEELADARAEIVTLHRNLERVQALRAQVEGYLFEGRQRDDAEELLRLRRAVLAEDQRALVSERTVTRLRARVEELVSSRETLFTRVAEWQQLIRDDGPEAADLSEFLAELLREILDLEHRNAASDARETRLRERLSLAGIDPDRVIDPDHVADHDRMNEPDHPVDPDPAIEPVRVGEPDEPAAGMNGAEPSLDDELLEAPEAATPVDSDEAPPVGAVADPTRSPEPVEPSEAEEGEEESEAVDSVAAEAVPHPEAADLADAADASNAANASDTANAADAHSVEAADPIEIVEFVDAPDPSRTVGAGDLDAELGAGEHAGIIEEHAEATGHDAAASEHAAPTRRGPVLKARPSNPATAVSSA